MSTNPPDRTDQIAALLQETVQITRSNAEARATNSSAIADTNAEELPPLISSLRYWCRL